MRAIDYFLEVLICKKLNETPKNEAVKKWLGGSVILLVYK